MKSLLDELSDIFAESWKRQGKVLYESYLRTVDMWERLDEIYADYAHDIGRSPLTWADKKQAILNYVLKQGEQE